MSEPPVTNTSSSDEEAGDMLPYFSSSFDDDLTKRRMYCLNCGKRGHISKKCKDPPTSYGIICFKITGDWSIYQMVLQIKYFRNIHHASHMNNINMYWFNNKNKDIRDEVAAFVEKLKRDVKFLLIRRKHSLGYIEFMRGRYDLCDDATIVHLIEQMTDEERQFIIHNNFDTVWDDLWRNTSRNKLYEKEYQRSFDRYRYIKEHKLDLLLNTKPKFNVPEWGFPKGRRNYMEKDIECAKREFMEESGLSEREFVVLDRIYPLNECFLGTNQVRYKHVYFAGVSHVNRDLEIQDNKLQIQEVGDIGWFNFEEMMARIRCYHTERRKIVEDLLYFLAFNIKYYQENDTVRTLRLLT
jgi:8-oxo-dGTP pyrophosphatase MutT (NUDIX family)